MDAETALSFLIAHQPLPDDDLISEEILKKYDEVRRYFIEKPDARCIPLFLNSFGKGSGFGLYQVVEDVLMKYSTDQVIPHLIESLESNSQSVRYWSAQIAANFPHTDLIKPLTGILYTGDSDEKSAALTALEQIDDPGIDEIFQIALERETDQDVIELITEAIDDRQG